MPSIEAPKVANNEAPPPTGEIGEADVIRIVASLDPAVLAARSEAVAAMARRRGTGLLPNPTVGWDRESVADEREDSLWLSVPLDVSSQRAVRRGLAGAIAASTRARAADEQRRAVLAALTLFYAVIVETERVEVREKASRWFDEAIRVVNRRKSEGQASGYDLVRIEIEAELTASKLAESRGKRDALLAALAALLDVDSAVLVVVGDLASTPAKPAESKPTSIRWREIAHEQARGAAETRSRLWVPMISLTAGLRLGSTGDDTDVGYLAGVGVEVPLFSRRGALADEAAATADLARSTERAAKREQASKVSRAQALLASTVAERQRFDEATTGRLARLEKASESGYRDGQRSVLELLDARRARAAVELRRLELSLAVKHAEIALRAASGEFE